MSAPLTITVKHFGRTYETTVEVGRYGNGRLAVQLHDEVGLFGTVTVNLPDQHLNEGEVFVKDWDDNAAMVRAMVEAGWLRDAGREVVSGFVVPKVMALTGALAEYVEVVAP